MKIGVVGAGGLGGHLAAVLSRAGHAVQVMDRGAHAAAIRQNGLEIVGLDEPMRVELAVAERVSELAGAETVFVTVKAYALPELIAGIRELALGGSTVVPLLNGVEALEALVEGGVPETSLVGGAAYLTAFKISPGRIERRGKHARLVLGEPTRRTTDRLRGLVAAFAETEVLVEIAPDIRLELWRKMVLTCVLAAGCGITRSAIGPVRDDPIGRSVLEGAAEEVVSVGRASGVGLTADDSARTLALVERLPPGFYPSLLHDLNAGRPTEVDVLSGAIARLGRRAGVPTPVHDAATAALQLGRAVPGASPWA